MNLLPHIVAVKSNVQLSVGKIFCFPALSDLMHDSIGQKDAAWLQTNDDSVVQLHMIFQDLVGQSLNC